MKLSKQLSRSNAICKNSKGASLNIFEEAHYIKNNVNQVRARWAMTALQAFSTETGQNLTTQADEAIVDLLCDLQHLCAIKGFNYDLLVSQSRKHFSVEAVGREF